MSPFRSSYASTPEVAARPSSPIASSATPVFCAEAKPTTAPASVGTSASSLNRVSVRPRRSWEAASYSSRREVSASIPPRSCARSRTARPSGEVDHAADPVLGLHQLEAAVHVVEREPVGDERRDVDVAGERAPDELRHLVAALDAAERRARDAAPRDQEARHDVERLALPGHPGNRAQAPAHPRRL